MTKPRVILGPSGAYRVRAETISGLPVLATPWTADLLVATVAYFRQALGFRLYGYAVLPSAFDAVIQPCGSGPGSGFAAPGARRGATISKIMMNVKGAFAYWYNRRLGRRGSVWEKRFADTPLLSAEEIRGAVLAVHAGPVALGLADAPQDYRWSGLAAARNPVRLIDPLPVRTGDTPVEIGAARAAS
ncbi:MAG: transposase [Planctomycetota bacterium]|jgi:hypothetical protein